MERPAPDSQLADYAVNREDPRRRAAYECEPAMKNERFVDLDVHAELRGIDGNIPHHDARQITSDAL
jgi:hypothetical protein